MKSVYPFLLLIGFVCLSQVSLGQQIQFREYRNKDGFTFPGGHQVFAQDSLGFLWIGTGGGLFQFDGYHFKVYKHDPQNPNSILTEGVQALSVDPGGKLWIIYDNRMQYYDGNIDGFVTVQVLPEKAIIRSVFFESPESLWIGSYGKGLFHYDLVAGTKDQFVNAAADTSLLEARNYIYDISYQGRYLILGTQEGIWKFDRSIKTFLRPFNSESAFIASWNHSYVNRILKAKDHFWISTAVKMVKLDTTFRVLGQAPVGNAGTVEDAAGNLWMPLYDKGLAFYDALDGKVTNYRHDASDPGSLPGDHIRNAFLDRSGNIWLGSFTSGICQIVKNQVSVQHYLKGQKASGVELLGSGATKELVVSTFGGGVFVSSFTGATDNLDFRNVSSIGKVPGFQDVISMHLSKSFLWCGSVSYGALGVPTDKNTGRLSLNQPFVNIGNEEANTISNGEATEIYQDPLQNLWIATMGFGGNLNKVYLNKHYGDAGSYKTYSGADPQGEPRGWISGLIPENDSTLWVGSYRGLELFHVETETFDRVIKDVEGSYLGRAKDGTILFGTKRGLYEGVKGENGYQFKWSPIPGDEFIKSVNEDVVGRRWIATGSGLYCYNPKDSLLIKLNDLRVFEEITFGSRMTDDGRYLLLTCHDGLAIVDVLSLKINTDPVIPLITRILVNNRVADVAPTTIDDDQYVLPESANTIESLTLDHNHRSISIELASMDLTAPSSVQYRYKLEGYEGEWRETPAAYRMATYTNLEPGDYKFLAKASNASGILSEQYRTLSITVLPPPWKTWWAYASYWMLGAGMLVVARRIVVQRERLKANLRLEHVELEKAKEVDRVKTSFFTNISHEFRTPLTLIKGPVETLLDRFKDDPDVINRLKLIQRNSDLLLRLINQLLDLAKLESGTLKVEKSEGEVNGFIRAAASSFESFARQKNITLAVEVPSGLHRALFDRDKLETILINLINNAIKFTSSGGSVKVAVTQQPRANPDSYREQQLSLVVSDTGIGIPSEHQSKVFERFHQVSEAHKEVGTGIGLSLVKELVTLMGGTISVKSEPGKGSEFTVILTVESSSSDKLYAASEVFEAKESLTPEEQSSRIPHPASRINGSEAEVSDKPQVLIVEDNPDLRAFIIDSLGTEFHFHEAENGKQGLAIATEHIPDMIISDVMMPVMDGMEMTRRIKSDIRTSHIPLIILTAKSGDESKLEGLSTGADDYLTKPFNKQELLLKVRNGTARMQKLREKLKVDVLSSAPAIEVESEDELFLQKVKETILERMSDELLSVESLADDMGMSRVQLYRKVSALTGMAVNELIRRLRLQRAAQLLQQEWGPVSQVAYEVGFSNLSYFSKVFKEEFGSLPSEYEEKA